MIHLPFSTPLSFYDVPQVFSFKLLAERVGAQNANQQQLLLQRAINDVSIKCFKSVIALVNLDPRKFLHAGTQRRKVGRKFLEFLAKRFQLLFLLFDVTGNIRQFFQIKNEEALPIYGFDQYAACVCIRG